MEYPSDLPLESSLAINGLPNVSASQPERELQIYLGKKRSRDGCLTCRYFKKGCDKEKPICSRCRTLKHDCNWPDPNAQPNPSRRTSTVKGRKSSATADEIFTATQLSSALQDHATATDLFISSLIAQADVEKIQEPDFTLTLEPKLLDGSPKFFENMQLQPPVTDSPDPPDDTVVSAAYMYAVQHWLGGSPKVFNAFMKHFRRLWTSSDSTDVAQRTVCETFGHAFITYYGLDSQPSASNLSELASIRSRAVELVSRVMQQEDVALSKKVSALIDLACAEFMSNGAPAFEHLVEQAEALLLQVFPRGSTINLATLRGFEQFGLVNYCWADICRAIGNSQPTAFNYVLERDYTSIEEENDVTGMEFMNGCPDSLTVMLAAISNFGALLDQEQPGRECCTVLSNLYQAQADSIATQISSFRPDISVFATEDGNANVARISIQEIWRQATWVHFYQAIYCQTGAFGPLRKAYKQMNDLYDVVQRGLPALLRGALPLPLFLLASIAVSDDQREVCRNRLKLATGNAVALKNNLAVIEQCWSETDRTGRLISYREILATGHHRVAFL